MTRFLLFAGGGADPSARLLVDKTVVTIGRAAGCDLVVRDPSVSRHHARARAVATGIALETEPGTAPLVHAGGLVPSVVLAPGEHAILGSTVLGVALAEAGLPTLRTELETATDGVVADLRGLSAVVSLVDELAGAADRAAVIAATDRWARDGLGAAAALVEVAARPKPSANELAIAMPGGSHALVFTFAEGGDERTDGAITPRAKALAAVAGSVVAAELAAVDAREALRAQSSDLRTLAVGSARDFLGESPAARTVDARIAKLAASDATALIVGESGTGKTFAARLIHEASARVGAPLRVLNCAAIPEALLEAELFGSERGAFSGAVATRIGAFEAAGDGTLLLDEIGELSLASQAKLLHAVEERRFERVGSNRAIELRARVIAATNRDLREMVDAGTFRSDLYFRISVVTLAIPPLRERGEDVIALAERMLADLAHTAGRRVTGFSPEALAALRRYTWPGNARELRNAIEHALVLGDEPLIGIADLPELVRGAPPAAASSALVRLPMDLRELEARAIEAALAETGGNRTRAAALLGINRVTLQKKLAPK